MWKQLFCVWRRFLTMQRLLIALVVCCAHQQLSAQTFHPASWQEIRQLAESRPDTLTVINFWATWCKPCLAEMPFIDDLTEGFDDKPVRVVFVSVDDEKRRATTLQPFLNKRSIRGEVWSLDNGYPFDWIDRIEPQWSGAIPATIFILGEKRLFYEEELNASTLQTIIQQIIQP